jgi:hypothetical protein
MKTTSKPTNFKTNDLGFTFNEAMITIHQNLKENYQKLYGDRERFFNGGKKK